MKIKTAKFVISNTDISKCPDEDLPEYAFIGRSNVGKSSLINMLTNHKNLAKISGKPGKTQLINHFIINDDWFLVDLPGYGFAKVSRNMRNTFQKFIRDYFDNRKQLVCTFVLVDSRHEPQNIDLDFMADLGENNIPFAIIFTKADKLNQTTLPKNIANYKKTLLQTWEELPPYFISSVTDKTGKKEILEFISNINTNLESN
ncbi:MAG: ribosome biogenesis GTP-binding protein YihA/YsxC [Flavobacteriaceae bacterium]|nr:ribosome biogenesis GTP-binding protein YihA/YsxC [Flavobacteriaceae bacterium]